MSESDDRPFSVSDRRHFTPEGRPREEQAGTPGDGTEAPVEAGPASAEPAAEDTAAPQPSGERPRPAGPVDFSAFLLSLGAQAGLLLSGGGEAGGEELDTDAALDGARQIIDILEMLQDKTLGRRTEGETRVLEDLLFQLRMAYVERTRGRRP
ncbi:MAG TPA: DUF1844 domain-containing protein [Vicinamibacteria bacterium]|nr:DUF1844 domain-containing protein [Vicinamibacteria bacterium]